MSCKFGGEIQQKFEQQYEINNSQLMQKEIWNGKVMAASINYHL